MRPVHVKYDVYMHHGQNRGRKKPKLRKKLKLNEIEGIYNFFINF